MHLSNGPPNERGRHAALRAPGILDTLPDAACDVLVRTAALACGVPIALICLLNDDGQWFAATAGAGERAAFPDCAAFCDETLRADDLFEVTDALADSRLDHQRLSGDPPALRFYAGIAVHLGDGAVMGTLCVIDRHPKRLTMSQRDIMRSLAQSVSASLEHSRRRRREKQAASDDLAEDERRGELANALPAKLHTVDLAGRILTVSDAWLETLGYARDEVIGRFAIDFLTPQSRETAQAAIHAQLLAAGRCDRVPCRMMSKAGAVLDMTVSAILERDRAGQPVRGIVVLEDITERLRLAAELADERQRLANLIDTTRAGAWEWNVRTGAMHVNESWARTLGWTVAELQPVTFRTWQDNVHPDDLTQAMALLQAYFDGWTDYYECDIRMRHRDGRWVWIQQRAKLITRTPEGLPERLYGVHNDITLRKLQEEALRKSEEFLERTGEVAGVGGWEIDCATGELHWSNVTCRLHRLPPGFQPTLEYSFACYEPEAQPVIRAAVARGMATGQGWDLELPLIRADGVGIWVRAAGEPTCVNGKPIRITGVFQDVTERVEERRALQQATERLSLATDSGGIGVWDWDIVSGAMVWDGWMRRLYGIEAAHESGSYELWSSHLHPDDRAATLRAVEDALAGGPPFDCTFRVVWADGSIHDLRACGRVVRDGAGAAARMVGASWDITEPRRLAAKLAEHHELLRVTLQSIGDGVVTTDARGNVVWLNPVAERMSGWINADAVGAPITRVMRLVHEETREPADNPVTLCLAEGKVAGLAHHTMLIAADGAEYGIEDTAAPIRSEAGEILGAVLVFHDVTEQRRLSGEMSYRASHDMLTGLVNRAEFETRLRRLVQRAHADGSLNALLYIDLDQFKLVNDACGHAVGDQLLLQVSKLLNDIVRASDTLARLGGDEFAVLLDHCSTVPAQRLAQRICDRMDDFRFVHEGRRFRIGASIGLVPVDNRWTTTAAVMQAADTSCYAAKEAGRNRVHVWFDTDSEMRARHGEMQWATRLEQALDEDGFTLFAQRIETVQPPATSAAALDGAAMAGDRTQAGEGRGVHAEVLLRLLKSDGTSVLPGAFLPAAERFHLASRIDRWVLRNVIQWLRSVPSLALIDKLHVNLSGQSVGDRAFHRWALDVLTEAGPRICEKLCLEITETAAVTNMADAARFIEQVRAVNVRVALDDFGAGASSFGYLKNMPVDYLKIDGQFIRDLVTDPLDEVAVRCFVDVAKVVRIKTVAEFVENDAVLQRLHSIGIDFAQGFLMHRPAPIVELLEAC